MCLYLNKLNAELEENGQYRVLTYYSPIEYIGSTENETILVQELYKYNNLTIELVSVHTSEKRRTFQEIINESLDDI